MSESFAEGPAQILVVEDDPENRDVMVEVLRAEGYSAFGAGDGLEALRYLAEHSPPRLILLDLMMPRMTGWEFRVRQRSDPRLADIPVLLVSAGPLRRDDAAAIGAVGCVRKPIRLPELLAAVRRCCA